MKFYNSDINSLVADALINCKDLYFNDFCTLSCRMISATRNSDGTIIPPRNIIELRREPINPQNTIILLISAAYNISNEEADKVYIEWLNNIMQLTHSGNKKYIIDGVGEIIISPYNSLVFKTDKKIISNINFLGQMTENRTEDNNIELGSLNLDRLNLPNIDEFTTKDNEPQNNEKNNNKEKPFWKNLSIIFCILFMISLSIGAFLFFKKPKEVVREVEIEKIVTDTIFIQKEEKKVKDDKYHVICGAYEIKQNAEKAADEYKKRGFNPIIKFVEGKDLYFVSINSFTSIGAAQKEVNKLTLTYYEEEGFWIYTF